MWNVFREALLRTADGSASSSSEDDSSSAPRRVAGVAERLSARGRRAFASRVIERSRGVFDTLRAAPERAKTAVRTANGSGLAWAMTRPGMAELGRILASGSQNPSLIYRLHAKNSPDKRALVWRDRAFTWAELDARVDRLAEGLERRGIRARTSIILMMRNRIEFVEVGAAAARVGAAAVSISWRSTAKELAWLAAHSRAIGIVTEPELLPVVEEARGELSAALLKNVIVVTSSGVPIRGAVATPAHGKTAAPESSKDAVPALSTLAFDAFFEGPSATSGSAGRIDPPSDDDASVIIYTSGTTGKPKGAVRKFPKDTMQAALRFINETPMRTDDVHLVACPLYHSTAFGFMALSLLLGNTVVLMDEFKPEAFLEIVERHGVTTVAVVPTMLQRVVDLPRATREAHDTRSLRVVFTGGAPLPGPLGIAFMDVFGDVLFNFYGATETGLVTLARPSDLRAAPATIGKIVPGNSIRLLSDDGRDVDGGAVGELYVKNNLLVAGYHQDDEATRASMIDGYFSVGDLARCDAEGRYFIEGRKRDMIISGGVNVYPAEVEGVLERHPDVAEVAVVGVPDREWGERVRAFVVRKAGASSDEDVLKVFARERLAGPKVPRDFVFIDALPRNPTGKVLKRELRERTV